MPLRERRDLHAPLLPWHRRWVRQGASMPVDAAGFLARYGDVLLATYDGPTLVTLGELADVPCVVALGDPGLGKSTALRAFVEDLTRRDSSARVVAHDLADLGSRDALRDRVFRSAEVEAWRAGDGVLHCVLDSFDESPIPIETLRSALLDELRQLPRERLRLVIACRTAVLPPGFVDALARLFTLKQPARESEAGEDACVVVEIGLLDRDDVRAAAAATLDVDDGGEAFLAAVIANDAGPFAARPITLRALLRRYAEDRTLAASQVELFREMCRELCDPVPPRPGAAAPTRALYTGRDERYVVAGRLCAAVLFGNRLGIFRGDGPSTSTQLVDPANCVGTEWLYGATLRVTEAVIAEALNTGLFTGARDEQALAAHQTLAEFMAAEWVVHRGLETVQALALLHDPTDPERRVVPQLRQVAAWLAALSPDVFTAVSAREPELVLWSDVVDVPVERRPALVDALLARTGENRLLYPGFGARARYAALAHAGLAAQLAPVIGDGSLPLRQRDCALEIARACRASGLAPLAAELALSDGEPLALRVEAAMLVSEAGDTPERVTLMRLAANTPADDVADELRGAALRASWHLLTPDELFAALVHPRRPNLSGTYSIALSEIAQGLKPEAADEYAVAATRWLAHHPVGHALGPLDEVDQAALLLALAHADDPAVLAALLTYIRRRLQLHLPFGERDGHRLFRPEEPSPRDVLDQQPAVRRAIGRALLNGVPGWCEPGMPGDGVGADGALTGALPPAVVEVAADNTVQPVAVDAGANVRWLWHDMPELLPLDDVPWAFGELAALPANDPRRAVWRDATRHVFDAADTAHIAAAFEHRGDPDVTVAADGWIAGHTSVESAREAFVRARDAQRAEWQARETARKAEHQAARDRQRPAPLPERLAAALARADAALVSDAPNDTNDPPSVARWWRVFVELVRDPESARHIGAEPATQTYSALSTDVSPEQCGMVVDAAVAFLREARGLDDPFPANGGLPWETLQGCVAAEVIMRLAPARLRDLTPAVWASWLPTLVRYEPLGGSPDRIPVTEVLEAATASAPDILAPILTDAIDAAMRDGGRGASEPALQLAARLDQIVAELGDRLAQAVYSANSTEMLLRRWLRADGRAQQVARSAAEALLASDVASSCHTRRPVTDTGEQTEDQQVTVPCEHAVVAAAALVAADDDAGWPLVGSRLERDEVFAEAVLLFGARGDALLATGSLDRLSEARIADLYLIAVRAFPPETDPWHVGVYSPTARDHVRRWRDSLLNTLEARATDAAVDALARIAAAAPERDWLVQAWLRASGARFGSRWRGTPARRLMRLAERPDARLVESGEQLLDVLEESLRRLDDVLQGEWRSVVGLWDQQRAGRAHAGWLPKDEGHLAHEIARHLRRDLGGRGVLVGRELVVQIGVPGAAPGLRTDIDVRARAASARGLGDADIRVIIEVKGSWHREVRTAMQTQLVDDYLVPHGVRHGLFVVGYYTCAAWSNSAEKRRSRSLGDRQTLEHMLAAQATGLSSPFRAVRAVTLDVSLPP